jgi:hypothetical protein
MIIYVFSRYFSTMSIVWRGIEIRVKSGKCKVGGMPQVVDAFGEVERLACLGCRVVDDLD